MHLHCELLFTYYFHTSCNACACGSGHLGYVKLQIAHTATGCLYLISKDCCVVGQPIFQLTVLMSLFRHNGEPSWTSFHGFAPSHTHSSETRVSLPLIRCDVSFHLISPDPCFFLIEAAANTIMVRIIPG